MKSSFWHMTHPCAYWFGNYRCKCGFQSIRKDIHNSHVFLNHSKEEAESLLSSKDYDKYYGDKLQTIKKGK